MPLVLNLRRFMCEHCSTQFENEPDCIIHEREHKRQQEPATVPGNLLFPNLTGQQVALVQCLFARHYGPDDVCSCSEFKSPIVEDVIFILLELAIQNEIGMLANPVPFGVWPWSAHYKSCTSTSAIA
jgi:methyl coenzyme M reductase subunit C-like uncharacterized protein (methanogenesis marker protein 7)